MPKLRPLRDPKEIAAVPPDQPVLIDLSEGTPAPEVKVEKVEPAPRPEPKPEPVPAEEESPLQKQLDEMRRAGEAQRAELVAERARTAQRDQELARERGGREQAEFDSVLNAINATEAEVSRAQSDYEAAAAIGDTKAQAEAQRRGWLAGARLVQLEDGKAAFEARRNERPAVSAAPAAPARPSVDAQIDALTQLSTRQRDWLKRHPDTMTDSRKNTRLGAAHLDAVDAGHSEDSDGYYQFIEERLGYRRPPSEESEDEYEPTPRRRSAPVSAPVSRDAPRMSATSTRRGQVELTAEQREAARISGVDDATYAKGVLELERRKAMGMYQERG